MMKITIVTATYNRRDLLKRLFTSLEAQRYEDIEWIVVDDGGSDDTEEVVQAFRKSAAVDIRFLRKENSGKDATVNAGLDLAGGDLVAVIDDDDYFVPNVFRQIADDYAKIAEDDEVAGLSYLTQDPSGKVWGRMFPLNYMISDHFDCRINQKIWGDKCEFTKATVLRDNHIRFLATKTRGGFGADTLFLSSIAERFKTCYINTAVLYKNFYETGIAVNWRQKGLLNPELSAAYYACFQHRRVHLRIRLRYMVAYIAITYYAGYPLLPPSVQTPWNRALFVLAYLPGMMIGARWKKYRKSGSYPQARHWMEPKN